MGSCSGSRNDPLPTIRVISRVLPRTECRRAREAQDTGQALRRTGTAPDPPPTTLVSRLNSGYWVGCLHSALPPCTIIWIFTIWASAYTLGAAVPRLSALHFRYSRCRALLNLRALRSGCLTCIACRRQRTPPPSEVQLNDTVLQGLSMEPRSANSLVHRALMRMNWDHARLASTIAQLPYDLTQRRASTGEMI